MPLPAALERAIAQYNTWIDGELRKEQDASKIGDTLYHYTNVAGLEGILKSEAVWFTDFRHMNDPSEISHGIELCRDVIRLRKPGKDGRVVLFLDCLADLMRLDNCSRALEYFIGRWNPQSIIGTTRKTAQTGPKPRDRIQNARHSYRCRELGWRLPREQNLRQIIATG